MDTYDWKKPSEEVPNPSVFSEERVRVLLTIAGLFAIVFFGWLLFFSGDDGSGTPTFQEVHVPSRVSLGQMIKDFHSNEARAASIYSESFFISVRVKAITKYELELAGGGYNHVTAKMKDEKDLLSVDRGDSLNLECEKADGSSDSLGTFIYLKGCEIVR